MGVVPPRVSAAGQSEERETGTSGGKNIPMCIELILVNKQAIDVRAKIMISGNERNFLRQEMNCIYFVGGFQN